MIGSAKHYNKGQVIQLSYCTLCRTVISVQYYEQGCTKTCAWSPRWLTFLTATSNICGCSVRNFLYIKLLAPRTFKRLLQFWKICVPQSTAIWKATKMQPPERESMLCYAYISYLVALRPSTINLYCCTVHLVDSLNITLPTNALIVCHLF